MTPEPRFSKVTRLIRLPRNGLLLGVALAMGLAAAWLGRQAVDERLSQIEQEAQRGQDMVDVVVANRDLAQGDVLTAQVLAVRQIPKQYAHASAISPDRFAQIDSARLQVPLQRGETLLQAHIDGLGQRVFSTILQKGMRALTFEVDEVSSTAGLLRPGDHIDLVYTLKPVGLGGADERQIAPLLSNLRVMATGQSITKQDARGTERRYTNVTLEVSPADANRILLARSTGEVTAILRHPDDEARNDAPLITAASLQPGRATGPSPPSAPARQPGRPIEYVIGGSAGAAPPGGGTQIAAPTDPTLHPSGR